MRNPRKLYQLLLAAVILLLLGWSAWSSLSKSKQTFSLSSLAKGEQVQSKTPKDPCWFMSHKDGSIPYATITERQDREMNGYPTEIALSEAIRIFNEETQCKALYAGYPPLTEDELIAAIVAGADYGKQGEIWRAQRDALWDIVARKKMPKGALLIVESGGRVLESPLRPEGAIEPKGIRITLILGLDQNNMLEGIVRPEQALLIRKTYSRVEAVG